MQWETVGKKKWNQFKGKVQEKWGKLTDEDLDSIQGSRDILVGKITQRYGYTRGTAEREVNEWMKSGDLEGDPETDAPIRGPRKPG